MAYQNTDTAIIALRNLHMCRDPASGWGRKDPLAVLVERFALLKQGQGRTCNLSSGRNKHANKQATRGTGVEGAKIQHLDYKDEAGSDRLAESYPSPKDPQPCKA